MDFKQTQMDTTDVEEYSNPLLAVFYKYITLQLARDWWVTNIRLTG